MVRRGFVGLLLAADLRIAASDTRMGQIEVRRGLYMDERTLVPHAALGELQGVVRDLLTLLAHFVGGEPPRTQDVAAIPAPAGAWLEAVDRR